LAEDVILYAAGKVIAHGPLETLRQRFLTKRHLGIRVSGDPRDVLRRLGYAQEREGEHWIVELGSDTEAGEIVAALVQAGLTVLEVREMGNPLESIYFEMEREQHHA
jgi:ABC-2 type transport system ATP-binding protein